MKIAVTGGTGFIGSHLVDDLLEEGHNVKVLGSTREPHREGLDFVKIDIKNLDDLVKEFKGIDVVYHLAAINDPKQAAENPEKTKEINEIGTELVFNAAKLNNVERVIFASTVWVYSTAKQKDEENNEQDTLDMNSSQHIYTKSKIAGEMICHKYAFKGQAFTILRYGIPYGPRMKPNSVVHIFLKKALKNEPITIHGKSQHRPFMYVKDLVKGNIAALSPNAVNKAYNLATKEYTLIELAETIKEFFPNLEINIDETERREGDYEGNHVSSSLALKELKWEAKTSLRQGLKEYISYLKEQEEFK